MLAVLLLFFCFYCYPWPTLIGGPKFVLERCLVWPAGGLEEFLPSLVAGSRGSWECGRERVYRMPFQVGLPPF